MHRIDDPSAVGALPPPKPPGTPGFFTGGAPASGQEATIVTDDWCNSVQEEISYVVEHAGLTLNKNDRTQLDQAIRIIGAAGVLGFTPVQQGGGAGQGTNKVYIGWAADGRLKAQVDSTDLGGLALLSSAGQHFTTSQSFDVDIAVTRDANVTRNIWSGGSISAVFDITASRDVVGSRAVTANNGNVTALNGRLRATFGARNSGDGQAATLLTDFYHQYDGGNQQSSLLLPNGYIIKSGFWYTYGGAPQQVGINFAPAFPSSLFSITCSLHNSTGNTGTIAIYNAALTGFSTFQCFSGGQANTYSFSYIATGM